MLTIASLLLPVCATWIPAPQQPTESASAAPVQVSAAEMLELADRLAPTYVDDGPGPDEGAVGPLLDLLLAVPSGGDSGSTIADADLTLAFERLAPNLQERHTDRIAAGLVAGALPNPDLAAQLLLAAPYSKSRVALARFALNEEMPAQQRAQAVGRILAADGRMGLETLRPLLHPQSDPNVLRRIYFYWAGMTTEDDLPFLEELVLQGPGMCREFALQTWARVEQRPEKRLEIFRHSETSGSSYRSVVVRLLARAGSSDDLEHHIKEMLSAPRSENRRLALDVLPYVAGPEAVLEEYHRRSSERDNLDQQGRWMSRLARLNLPEARQIAADWLMERGWQHARYSLAVAKSLAETDALDALLGSFLAMNGPSAEVKLVLASARVAHSADALDYLRRVLPAAAPMHAIRICTVLGRNGDALDLEVLYDFARSPARQGMVRAAAVRQLAACNQAQDYLRRLAEGAELDFETAEAIVVGAIRNGDPELRKLGLELAKTKPGLVNSAWQAQTQSPQAADAPALLARLERLLNASQDPFADQDWPEPRDMESEFHTLILLTQAAAAASPGDFYKQIPDVARNVVPSAVYLCAQSALPHAPQAAWALASELAGRSELKRLARVRALGLVARAAQAAGHTEAHLAALDRMLALLKRDRSEAVLLELAFGMAFSSPRGWLAPRDQLAQRRVLAYAASQSPAGGRTPALRTLTSGGCPAHTLIEALELLLETMPDDPDYVFPSNAFLAEDLAYQALDIEPDNVQARWLLVRALLAEESPEEAVGQLDEIMRLAPPDSAPALEAAALKKQLLSELVEED